MASKCERSRLRAGFLLPASCRLCSCHGDPRPPPGAAGAGWHPVGFLHSQPVSRIRPVCARALIQPHLLPGDAMHHQSCVSGRDAALGPLLVPWPARHARRPPAGPLLPLPLPVLLSLTACCMPDRLAGVPSPSTACGQSITTASGQSSVTPPTPLQAAGRLERKQTAQIQTQSPSRSRIQTRMTRSSKSASGPASRGQVGWGRSRWALGVAPRTPPHPPRHHLWLSVPCVHVPPCRRRVLGPRVAAARHLRPPHHRRPPLFLPGRHAPA